MSNSHLAVHTNISPNQSGKRSRAIDRITPHCVVGQCTAEALGALFANPGRQASSNYGIDRDGRVGMYVEEDCVSWCSSSGANDGRAVTIECALDVDAPWAFRQIVFDTLIDLCVDICKRNCKKKLLWFGDKDVTLAYTPSPDEMILTVHRWFAQDGRRCPGDWCYERLPILAEKVTSKLNPEPETHWYDEAMKWAEDNKIMMDGRPNDPVTRAEMATMLMRYDALKTY